MDASLGLNLRVAERPDLPVIFGFIQKLAEYEDLLHEVKATEQSLAELLFDRKIATAVIAESEGRAVGFALYYYSVSTFIGQAAIFIEDLFVLPEYRGRGYGKTLFQFLAQQAIAQNCWGLEWACLDWNEPSIRFYKSLGAVPRDEWTTYRLKGEALATLAGE